MSNKVYSNNLIGFDIETTTFEYNEAHYTDMYLASFVNVHFNLNISIEEIEKTPANFVRSWREVNSFLKKLNQEAVKRGHIQIIYVHNLGYEFDGLIKNCQFVQENFDNSKALFIKSRKPCVVTLDHIELRCSLQLTGKSLRALGEQYGYEKLDIDYQAQFFSFSKLPKEEFVYNERDVKLMLYAVIKECSKFNYIKLVEDIPYTVTGLTRQLNKEINSKENNQSFQKRNIFQRYKDIEYIKYLQIIFIGGYTHANIYAVGVPLSNVHSIDIVSSYPASMLFRYYPYNFKKCVINDTLKFFNWMLRQNQGNYQEKINSFKKPFKYSFFATVTLKNIQVKNFNNCTFPVISCSKCLNEVKLCLNDNGRVAQAHEVKVAVTEVDYWLIEQFYNFELAEVENVFYTSSHRPLHDFTINCVLKYADEKSVLKKVCEKVENAEITVTDFYCERSKDFIFSMAEIENILNLPKDEQVNLLTVLLKNAKGKLNAQYGIQVQKLFQETYNYIIDIDVYEKYIDYNLPRVLYRNFEEGLYITAYSRLTLFTMALKLLDNKLKPQYSDTDSWKVEGDVNEVKRVVNEYNDEVEKQLQCSKIYNIGYFDFEESYKDFCTWGCKKYIASKKNKILATIAGVPKNQISKALTELYHDFDFDFDYLCKMAFSPNTVYSNSVTNKLSTKYKHDFFNGFLTDCNGKTGNLEFNSMVELVPTDYVLLDTIHNVNPELLDNEEYISPNLNRNYLKFVQYTQNRYINLNEYTVIKKENEKIIAEYVPTYSNTIIENLDTKDCEV